MEMERELCEKRKAQLCLESEEVYARNVLFIFRTVRRLLPCCKIVVVTATRLLLSLFQCIDHRT